MSKVSENPVRKWRAVWDDLAPGGGKPMAQEDTEGVESVLKFWGQMKDIDADLWELIKNQPIELTERGQA